MKILAVIPARAESKGIPNKNIRIVGEHPLVFYAINNALHSQYITNVIVTTDSDDVKTIAEQMGAKTKWRDKSLCGDAVTLDPVIFDAIQGEEGDYIVTLQPTSPTLKVDTLDKAIKYTIENGFDTVISAINQPCLSWSEESEKKIPNYAQRLNHQFLPPNYIETGAFNITKREVVTSNNHIGPLVDIYEVPDDESINVDDFIDLQSATAILEKKKVAFYVNGNLSRGMGHVYRALELADEFYCKPDIIYDLNQTDPAVFGRTTHNIVPVNGIAELFERCRHEKYTIFINDILSTSIDYMIGLRTVLPNAKIINFEDDGEGISEADLVFNALFQESLLPNVYSGEKYYISGKTFMFYNPICVGENVKNVFISFGGADPQNYSDRILRIISKPEYEDYHFVIALGRAKDNVDELMEFNKYSNIEVFYDVPNMPGLMSSCDIAVTSRGRTGYELALLGIPTIAMAQNKREEKHRFISNENGFTYIGLNPSDEIIEGTLKTYLGLTKESRQQLQDTLLSHDLRGGRKRVMGLINNL